MQYKYVAYTLKEGIVKGWMEGRSESDVQAQLSQEGYKTLQVKTGWHPPSLEELIPSLVKVKTGELVRFSRQLATMVMSGASRVTTLEMLSSDSNSRGMKRVLLSIMTTLDEGGSLSEALAKHPKIFSKLYVMVVEVGEMTGGLGTALEQLADILEAEAEAKAKAIRTLMYPLAIIGLSTLTLGVLMVVALPALLAVFDQMGAEIPGVTKFAVTAMGSIKDNFLNMIFIVLGLFIGIKLFSRFPIVNLWIHMFMVKAPVLGSFIVSGELSRMARTVSMLLSSGVNLSEGVRLAISGTKNRIIQNAFLDAEESLLTGHGFADALKNHPVLPHMFVELVGLGERSNSLEKTMGDLSEAYQKQLERQLDSLLGMLEPASTLIVGGIVGFIAFSMFVPIYSGLNAVP
ncbi:MAG: type II secretion system F family protein [Chloroflexi bacterium]|nr:type II secretion system F family protein [Chloroflexota bacterium]